MRIGMICPYSLTVAGGVQSQVLGLARALRRRGQRVRVLAPCDGPPPDAGVTPLGNSLPTLANGSILLNMRDSSPTPGSSLSEDPPLHASAREASRGGGKPDA